MQKNIKSFGKGLAILLVVVILEAILIFASLLAGPIPILVAVFGIFYLIIWLRNRNRDKNKL
jgi:Flp pilus assembly protein TadB